MTKDESIIIKFKRFAGTIYITVIDVIVFIVLLKANVFSFIDLKIFASSFIEIIGVLFGLTFTSYAILLSIMKTINYNIRKTKGFGVIGYILFLTVIFEIITLGIGLSLLTVKNLTTYDSFILGCGFILFSLIILSYVVLMVYYMTLTFNNVRVEE